MRVRNLSVGLYGKRGGPRFDKVMRELYRKLLVANVGADETETQWPSAVIGLFATTFPAVPKEAGRISPDEAMRRIQAKVQHLAARVLERWLPFR